MCTRVREPAIEQVTDRTVAPLAAGAPRPTLQMLLFVVEDGRVRTVDQYIGNPTAVTAFWA